MLGLEASWQRSASEKNVGSGAEHTFIFCPCLLTLWLVLAVGVTLRASLQVSGPSGTHLSQRDLHLCCAKQGRLSSLTFWMGLKSQLLLKGSSVSLRVKT